MRPPHIPHVPSSENRSGAGPSASLSRRSLAKSTDSVSYGETGLSVGTTEDFWVDYYDSYGYLAFDQIEASLAVVTDHAYIWVATSSASVNDEVSTDFDPGDLDASKLQLLGDAFEAVVFPEDTAIFGFERGGGDGGDGGVDSDQHISILVFDIDFDNNESGSYVAGYFWSKDDYDADDTDVYAATHSRYPSNGRELFYLDAVALDEYPYTIVSTLAHEYQHMINYNRETYEGRTESTTWLDEFRSLAAEDLLAPAFAAFSASNGYSDDTGAAVAGYDFDQDGPGYWAYYLSNYYPYYSYAGLNSWSSTVDDYAFASLFGAYLLRAYGGVDFLSDEVAAANDGYSNEESFTEAFDNAIARVSATDGSAPASGALTDLGSSSFYAAEIEPFILALFDLGADGTDGASPFSRDDAKAASSTTSSSRSLPAITALSPEDFSTNALTTVSSILGYSFSLQTSTTLTSGQSDTATLTLTAPSSGNILFRLIALP